jgi:hypothetical protein
VAVTAVPALSLGDSRRDIMTIVVRPICAAVRRVKHRVNPTWTQERFRIAIVCTDMMEMG